MIVTEQEAQTKWCPFSRVAGMFEVEGENHPVYGSNRFGNPFWRAPHDMKTATMCIGSGCMMWRQGPHGEGDKGSPTGYCGLAGAPR